MEQEAKAITINQYGAYLVAINSKRGSSIIHEAEHIRNSIRVRGNLTLSFCPYCKYFTYTSKSNLFTML